MKYFENSQQQFVTKANKNTENNANLCGIRPKFPTEKFPIN